MSELFTNLAGIKSLPVVQEPTARTTSDRDRVKHHPLLKLNPLGLTPRFPWNYSASQIDTWRLCQRKWGYGALERIRGQNRFAARGTEVHRHVENWLVYGTDPPEDDRYGLLARVGIKHLPLPNTCEVEREFEFISPLGHRYTGAIDVAKYDEARRRPVIWDHKSTTSKKWALTSDTLRTNVQAVIYGLIAAIRWQADEIDLNWLYYIDVKNRARCHPVSTTVTFDHLLFEFDKIEQTAREMAEFGRSQRTAAALPPNALACEQYGGCPHRDRCPLTDEEKMEAIMEQSSLREKLMQRAKVGGAMPAQAATPAATQTATPAATQTAPVAQPSVVQQPAQPAVTQQAPAAQPAGKSVLDKMKAQASASAAKGATVTNIHASLPAAQTNAASQPTVAPPATNLLQKLKQRAAQPVAGSPSTEAAAAQGPAQAPADPVDRVEAAGLAALEEAAALNEVEPELPDPVSFQASDVNPPEQPDTPVDDPDALARQTPAAAKSKKAATETQGENAAEDEKKKRGRPTGSVTVKPLTDDGYIFGRAYEAALMVFQDEAKAQVCAQNALKSFREVRA